jgi:hypothetical protein
MSDKFQNLVVVLDNDSRSEDVEDLIKAIKRFKGVAAVNLGIPNDLGDYLARTRESNILRDKLWDVLR